MIEIKFNINDKIKIVRHKMEGIENYKYSYNFLKTTHYILGTLNEEQKEKHYDGPKNDNETIYIVCGGYVREGVIERSD